MRMKISIGFAVLLASATVFAYGEFYTPYALGPVTPAAAGASLTCYPVDSDFELVSANSTRDDILATFVRKNANSTTAEVCFLRPSLASFSGGWTPRKLPEGVAAPLDRSNSCPGYPNAPSPGMTCHADGGWR